MTTSNITLTRLDASEGHKLLLDHAIASTVYLGTSDSPDNWTEITDAEAEALQAQWEEEEKQREEAETQAAAAERG